MYRKYSTSSSESNSTISNLRRINRINTINNINYLSYSNPLLYPSYQTQINNNYQSRKNPFNSVANQIISPRNFYNDNNNNNIFTQKRFSRNYNNNSNNNINNNYIKGSPVQIHQDIKKTQCCAHNGCSAYISDVLLLLKSCLIFD